MGSDPGRVGAGLTRCQGLLWLLLFALIGWGLAALVELRPPPPRLLLASRTADAKIECYGGSEEIDIALVSRLDTTFDAGRMVLTVPVVDDDRDDGEERGGGRALVVIPAGARSVLVDEEGAVTVLASPLPPPLLHALFRNAPTLRERIEGSKAALAALRSLPRVRDFLMRP